jgi:DNA-binding phage protein
MALENWRGSWMQLKLSLNEANPTLSSLKSMFDALGLQTAVKAKSDENKQ